MPNKSHNKSHTKINIEKLQDIFQNTENILIGAGSGLSTAAGFFYSGERFWNYFGDFAKKYGFQDMYSGGFYPFKSLEEHWAYWSRYIYINRYMTPPNSLYHKLHTLVKEKDYFVITTNVDHCFQKAGFDKERLYYTQGDYGLFQCSQPCHNKTYDNEEIIRQMILAQGYQIDADGTLYLKHNQNPVMSIPTELIPRCPKCGKPMSMNLRADDTFVQDDGWYIASKKYELFLERHQNKKMLLLELGVGYNTPGIIKYPFWQMTKNWDNITYACLNMGETFVPDEIKSKSICINKDIYAVISRLEGETKLL